MDIQDKTNEELRTKLNNLLQEKNSLWVQIEKLAAGLVIANEKLSVQNKEKENRAAELVVANTELAFQNEQKEKRAAELVVTNEKLRESEVSLVKSNETFLKLFDCNPASMGIRRISDSMMVNVNAAFLELFGFASKEEVIGKTSVELKLVPDQEKYRVDSIIAQMDEVSRDFEVQLLNKNEDSLWVSASLLKLEIDNEPCMLTVGIDITERKKAEEELKKGNAALTISNAALRESETSLVKSYNTFFKLFDNNPCAISINSTEGRKYLNVNDAFLKLYGFSSKEEVIGKTGVELGLVTETDSDTVDEIAINNTFSKDFEVNIQARNGKKLCISASMLNIEIDNTPCVVVVSIDITERKKAEEELRRTNTALIFENEEKKKLATELVVANIELAFQNEEKEKRAAELIVAKEKSELYLDMAGSAFVSLDKNGNILLVNKTCLEILEYDKSEELKGKNWFDTCIPPEINEQVKQVFSKLVKGKMEGVEDYENEVVTKSGKRRLIYWNNSLIKDEEGQIKELLSSGIDITERNRSKEALIKSNDEFHLLAESMPQIVWIALPDGMNIYFNQQWVDYTGLTLEESYALRWIKAFHPDDQERAWNAWQNAVTNNAEYSLECRLRRKDGDYFWWLVRGVPVLDEKGNNIKWFGTLTDIQNIKETEIELIKAKEKAEESDRLKLAFLANMSHEIRTPMNGILGFTELLKEPKLTGKKQQKYIKIIEKSGKRMLNIINDIINISKVESGEIEVVKTETDINDVLQYLLQFFTNETMQEGIQLSLKNKLNLNEKLIKTDKEKLYAALTNLLKNAIKFTPNLGTINFGCERKGEYLEFFVKDSGIGISISQQEIIFDRFRQAEGTSNFCNEGSGLGLAISKAYIEILGGKIWLKSKEGNGSTFYFTLPYDPVIESLEKGNNPEKAVAINRKENKVKELKILIAEDDKISKFLISIMTKPFSREVIMVSNGLEAVEACRNNPDLDLILIDMNMPQMGGFEAVKLIREFNNEIIIIAQTANGMEKDRDDAITAGCTDYISKPINKAELLALMHKYFN